MAKYIPEVSNIRTPLDEHGSFLGVQRIIGESLVDYKRRLLETNINTSASTYKGLINGVTRELGLLQKRGFRIDLKSLFTNSVDSSDVTLTQRVLIDVSQTFIVDELVGLGLKIDKNVFRINANTSTNIQVASGDLRKFIDSGLNYEIVAYNPFIRIDGNALYLFRDFFSETNAKLDTKILLRESNTFISDVIDLVNDSKYFSASLPDDNIDTTFAFSLERQVSIKSIANENIPAIKNFSLTKKNLIEGSIRFSEAGIFRSFTDEELVSTKIGNFFVDTGQGFVIVNGLPSGRGTVSYLYSEMPFDVMLSPVIISNFKDKASQDFLFNSIEQRLFDSEFDRFKPGLPNLDMVEYIYELLNVTPLFWGE